MDNDIYSFYKLISEYKIIIPVMQRSYAEGRKTKHAEDVRKSIIASMIKATAKEEKLSYSANLVRLSGRDIVVQVNI